ncbi:hypothetical protein PCCS19_27350 [Paenibacillus sp. CCS19]|uniref:hypothetical protein n=1 Tax=Paenibacillus sp. CCS19 TaxID=3158387 RepID=UPI00256DFABF|nr:hypothetical protein [Paenibacillus cellulosilyticus]GMK39681.1 hypothetical protein PCCS19_27350 [Paenibacillus cellulosilyticus]
MIKSFEPKLPQRRSNRPSSNASHGAHMYAGDLARPVPRLNERWNCKQTTQLLNSYAASPCAVVCDAKDRPIGLIMRDRFFLQITSGDWHTMNELPITRLMNEPFIVDAQCTLAQLKEQLIRLPMRPKHRYVVVTSAGQSNGVIVFDERLCPIVE